MGYGRGKPSPSSLRPRGYAWRKVRDYVRNRDGYRCVECGVPAIEVDHIITVAEGGTDDPSNLQVLCSKHHRLKTIEDIKRIKLSRVRPSRYNQDHPGKISP